MKKTGWKHKAGGNLKPIPAGNKGLPKLPKEVRNKMGFMKDGGGVGYGQGLGYKGQYQNDELYDLFYDKAKANYDKFYTLAKKKGYSDREIDEWYENRNNEEEYSKGGGVGKINLFDVYQDPNGAVWTVTKLWSDGTIGIEEVETTEKKSVTEEELLSNYELKKMYSKGGGVALNESKLEKYVVYAKSTEEGEFQGLTLLKKSDVKKDGIDTEDGTYISKLKNGEEFFYVDKMSNGGEVGEDWYVITVSHSEPDKFGYIMSYDAAVMANSEADAKKRVVGKTILYGISDITFDKFIKSEKISNERREKNNWDEYLDFEGYKDDGFQILDRKLLSRQKLANKINLPYGLDITGNEKSKSQALEIAKDIKAELRSVKKDLKGRFGEDIDDEILDAVDEIKSEYEGKLKKIGWKFHEEYGDDGKMKDGGGVGLDDLDIDTAVADFIKLKRQGFNVSEIKNKFSGVGGLYEDMTSDNWKKIKLKASKEDEKEYSKGGGVEGVEKGKWYNIYDPGMDNWNEWEYIGHTEGYHTFREEAPGGGGATITLTDSELKDYLKDGLVKYAKGGGVGTEKVWEVVYYGEKHLKQRGSSKGNYKTWVVANSREDAIQKVKNDDDEFAELKTAKPTNLDVERYKYAKGGGVGKFKVGDRIVDVSYSNGHGEIIKVSDNDLYVVQFDRHNKGEYRNMNGWDMKKEKYAKGGGVDDYTKNLGMVKVKFANPKYDYETSVSGSLTEKDVRDYFVGKSFNVVSYPNELFEKVVDIEFSPKGTYAEGGMMDANEENREMVMNNNVQIMHHADELKKAVKDAKYIPAWVVAKVYEATTALSNVTHYLDGTTKTEG